MRKYLKLATLVIATLASTSAMAQQSWKKMGVIDNASTDNQLCRYVGDLLYCDTTSPTVAADGSVGISSTSPRASLDVSATDAIIVPGGTTAQQPGSPINGMIRYNSDNNKFEAYENGAWVNMVAGAGALAIDDLSDAITYSSSVFLGSGTGANDNGAANQNTAVGESSLNANITGAGNTSLGYRALNATTASNNTAVGANALDEVVAGERNTAVGSGALGLATGSSNIAFGYRAGYDQTTGDNNIIIGREVVLPDNTASNQMNIGNTIYGDLASTRITIGSTVTSVGLDVATTDAIVAPRGTTAQRPGTPVNGMIRYNSDDNLFEVYQNSAWANLVGAAAIGELSDVSATSVAAATDGQVLTYNNATSEWIAADTGIPSTIAIDDLTDGVADAVSGTVYLGFGSGVGLYNTAVGIEAADAITSGDHNTAVGRQALSANITGVRNVAIGSGALLSHTSSDRNTAIGTFAMENTTAGGFNVAVGVKAMQLASGAGNTGNIAAGYTALQNNTGDFNVALGYAAMDTNTSGIRNVALGTQALQANATGNYNTGLGHLAGDNLTSGEYNIAIGAGSDFPSTTGSNQLVIGNSLYGDVSNHRYSIGTTTTTVGLDVATTDAIVAPRGTTAQRPTAVNGMIRYNTDNNLFEAYQNGGWTNMIVGAGALSIDDLSDGINDAESVFLGQFSGTSDDGANANTAVGNYALLNVTSGTDNSAFGRSALQTLTTATENTAFGNNALRTVNASFNSAFGKSALYTNATGTNNVAMGYQALVNSTGSDNVAIGSGSGATLTAGSNNIAIGSGAIFPATTGSNQFIVGDSTNGLLLHGDIANKRLAIGNVTPTVSLHVDGTDAILVPTGTTAQQPGSPANGMIRYNTDNNLFEAYQNGGWTNVIGATALAGLTDVSSTSVGAATDGQVLTYNNATSEWISADIPAALWTDNTTHISREGIVAVSGTYTGTSALPADVEGAGTRMFFDPTTASFRAGYVSGTQWNDANMGNHSIALGNSNTASGIGSLALGYTVGAVGDYSTAIGDYVNATGYRSAARGHGVNVSGDYSLGYGGGNAAGANPTVSGASSVGFFLGDRSGDDLAQANTMAIMGGSVGIGTLAPNTGAKLETSTGTIPSRVGYANGGNHYGFWANAYDPGGGYGVGLEVSTGSNPSTNVYGARIGVANTDGTALHVESGSLTTGKLLDINHLSSAFAGDMITGSMANGSGSFTGNFINFTNNTAPAFIVDSSGNIGVGTASPRASIDVSATDAIIVASGTTAQQPGSPVNGMIRYNTTTNLFEGYQNSAWASFLGAQAIDDLTDGIYDGSSLFVGNGAGANDDGTANSNTGFGKEALMSVTSGSGNTAVGRSLVNNVTGNDNVAVGIGALNFNTSSNNVAVGNSALELNVTGNGNVAFGREALQLSTGHGNIALGNSAGALQTAGDGNIIIGASVNAPDLTGNQQLVIGTAIHGDLLNNRITVGASNTPSVTLDVNGTDALIAARGTTAQRPGTPVNGMIRYNSTTNLFEGYQNSAWASFLGAQAINDLTDGINDGSSLFLGTGAGAAENGTLGNTAVGSGAMGTTTTGFSNTAFGFGALDENNGDNNVAVGYSALGASGSTGTSNIGIGRFAGNTITSGSYNIAIGDGANVPSATGNYQLNIGGAIYGDMTADAEKISIGTTVTTVGLDVATTDAVVIPRGTTAQRPTAVNGMIRYNSDTNLFEGYQNSAWASFLGAQSINDLTDAIVTGGSYYFGLNAGDADDGTTNTNIGIGDYVLTNVTTGHSNIGIGVNALSSGVTSIRNVAIGSGALYSATGDDNLAIGSNVGYNMGSGGWNILIGKSIEAPNANGNFQYVVGIDGNPFLVGDMTAGSEKLSIGTSATSVGLNVATTDAVKVAAGTTAQRPTAANGMIRYNTDNNNFEVYENSGWADMVTSISGNINTTTVTYSSDEKWKKNIHTIEDSLEKILSLRGVTYDWKVDEFANKHFPEGKQVGLIAQEVEEVFPEVVKDSGDGKGVNYAALVAPLIEAVKAQQKQIDELKAEIKTLKGE